jgi:hypothetical protein
MTIVPDGFGDFDLVKLPRKKRTCGTPELELDFWACPGLVLPLRSEGGERQN